jgi:hypothetical protein
MIRQSVLRNCQDKLTLEFIYYIGLTAVLKVAYCYCDSLQWGFVFTHSSLLIWMTLRDEERELNGQIGLL